MARQSTTRKGERGQMIALFALASTVIILAVGLVIDGGYALAQRRGSQNASDFAALAGARVVALWVSGDTTNGTDGNVMNAISNSIAANGGTALTFTSPNGPVYIKSDGTPNGFVGTITGNVIPAGTTSATTIAAAFVIVAPGLETASVKVKLPAAFATATPVLAIARS